MPPKSTYNTGSFSAASDVNNEVVCPLKNNDGSNCRKRCNGDKKYRSIQEHIRRAHPENYIPKLPATEESFRQMIDTPPSARPPPPPPQPAQVPSQTYSSPGKPPGILFTAHVDPLAYGHDRESYGYQHSSNAPPRSLEDQYPAAATAAVALAQLHHARPDSDWDSEAEYASEAEARRRMHPSVELPPIQSQLGQQTADPYTNSRPKELLPSMMAHSPPERSSTLPPIERREPSQRKERGNRPRKSSITQNSRRPRHEKGRSKDYGRRLSIEGRKAFSAEPPGLAAAAAKSRRWEDLVEAAASATEVDSDRDITPTPQSPTSIKRASLPPLHSSITHNQSYKASPLAHTFTPPPPQVLSGPPPFQRGEPTGMLIDSTSAHSGAGPNFQIPSSGLSSSDTDTSPTYYSSQHTSSNSQSSTNGGGQVQIYCAHCRRPSVLLDSFACTECISGFCMDCMWMLNGDVRTGARGRPCPRCQAMGARYRPIRLEVR